MTNDIEKYSDITAEEILQPEGKVTTSEIEEKQKQNNSDYVNSKKAEHDSLVERYERIGKEAEPIYKSHQEDSNKLRQAQKELNELNNEITTMENELKRKENLVINKGHKSFIFNLLSSSFIIQHVAIILLKLTGHPTLDNSINLIEYLYAFPMVTTGIIALLTYPATDYIKNRHAKIFKESKECKDIENQIDTKKTLRDAKEIEISNIKEQMKNRRKLIDDYEYRMRCIKWQIENIIEEVMGRLFKTPNNGTLGISIEKFGEHQTLSLKL